MIVMPMKIIITPFTFPSVPPGPIRASCCGAVNPGTLEQESLASRLNPRLEALAQKRDWSGRSDLRSMGKVLDTGEPFGTLDQAYGQDFRLLAEVAAIREDSVVLYIYKA